MEQHTFIGDERVKRISFYHLMLEGKWIYIKTEELLKFNPLHIFIKQCMHNFLVFVDYQKWKLAWFWGLFLRDKFS